MAKTMSARKAPPKAARKAAAVEPKQLLSVCGSIRELMH
jgi:hypothetical protein